MKQLFKTFVTIFGCFWLTQPAIQANSIESTTRRVVKSQEERHLGKVDFQQSFDLPSFKRQTANWRKWVEDSINQSFEINHDGYDFQCVDYVQAYAKMLGIPLSALSGNANQLLNFADQKYFDVFKQSCNQLPRPGDIFVYDDINATGNSFGHTGIVIQADESGMIVADQNFNSQSFVTRHRYPYDYGQYGYLIGWLHPKMIN